MSSPSQVYRTGIGSPSSKAGDENSITDITELAGSNTLGVESSPPQEATIRATKLKINNADSCDRYFDLRKRKTKS